MNKNRIHIYFWITALCLLLLSFYWQTFTDEELILNIHDTYFIISYSNTSLLFAFLYLATGLIYYVFRIIKIPLKEFITKIHTIILISVIPIYSIGNNILKSRDKSEFPLFDDTINSDMFIIILAFIFIIAQLFFILNIIMSLIKHLLKRQKS